jgi:hypothetical protein
MKLVADPAAARVERVDIRAFLLEDLELGIEIGGGV